MQMMEKKSNTYKNDRTSEIGRTNPMQTEQRKDLNIKAKADRLPMRTARRTELVETTHMPNKNSRI